MNSHNNRRDDSILFVDDDKDLLRAYRMTLRAAGIGPVISLSDSSRVLTQLEKTGAKIIFLDLTMPPPSGSDLLPIILARYPNIPVIILTACQEMENAVDCIKMGAYDYLVKPVSGEQIIERLKKAVEVHNLKNQVSNLKARLLSNQLEHKEAFDHIVTRSPKMVRIFQYIESIADSNEPILITGETGVGKELIAKAIHNIRSKGEPFVAENVAGLDDSLFADVIFGHSLGAFTGAVNERQGLISKAEKGSLFLDEIGDLSPNSQMKLLRLIQETTYSSIGSDVKKKFKARIILSTNVKLDDKIENNNFRRDLFYRITTHRVHIPPLRDRIEDIPLLVSYFFETAATKLKKTLPPIESEFFELASRYYFPGNIRELRAIIFDVVAQYRENGPLSLTTFRSSLKIRTIADSIYEPTLNFDSLGKDEDLPTLKDAQKIFEENLVNTVLAHTKGNQSKAASVLGISRQALYKRMKMTSQAHDD